MATILTRIRGVVVPLPLIAVVLGAQVIQAQVNVTTYHNDNARTGQNLSETILTLANVTPATFGKLFTQLVDGNVYAQPLYLSDVEISPGVRKNLVFVATERDTIYAFDADSNAGSSGGLIWRNALIDPDRGITWVPSPTATPAPDVCCCCPDITPDVGISATPVIDASKGILYTIATTKELRGGEERHYVQTLYALDVATGTEVSRFVIGDTTVTGATCGGLMYSYDDFGPTVFGAYTAADSVGGVIHFNALTNHQRTGLVLHNGVIYASWSSHCDRRPYHGWIMSFDAATLQLISWFNTSPGLAGGAFSPWGGGIWMGGGAPAIDERGYVYLSTGNGSCVGCASGQDVENNVFGEAVLQLSTTGLSLYDFFVPHNQRTLDGRDWDLGSGGVLLLPDQKVDPQHLLVTAGKEGTVYLIDRDNMGEFSTTDDNVVQVLPAGTIGGSAGSGLQGTPALFGNLIYFVGSGDYVKAFEFSGGRLSEAPVSRSTNRFGNKGATASVSANGDKDGIVWTIEYSSRNAVLHAYDAMNLDTELYNSGPDGVIGGSKFSLPTIANGKVFIGIGQSSPTDLGGLVVFGLL